MALRREKRSSFRARTLKVCAQNGAEPGPFSVGRWDGEWLDEVRLEQRWELENKILWGLGPSEQP